jgi:hypothetical protein
VVSKLPSPQRVCVPNLLNGEYTGVIIGTFGASLDFAEKRLFSQLSRSTLNRVVLADSRQLSKYFSTGIILRRLNRSYIACPVLTPRAHHPKFILLLGPNRGRLIVGSGNLSIGGYAGAGECFAVHEWVENENQDLIQPFLSLKEMLFDQIERGFIDRITSSRIRDVFDSGKWIEGEPNGTSTVIHNSRKSLIDQLVAKVSGSEVKELIAAAPFHDQSATAINELLRKFSPEKFSLLVQNKVTKLNVVALNRVFSKHKTKVKIIEAQVPERYGKTFIHAKFILVRTTGKDYLLQGSANLSSVALCESGTTANVELCNMFIGESGEFDYLINDLKLTVRNDGLSTFEPDQMEQEETESDSFSEGPRDVCWRPPILSGWVSKDFGAKVEVFLTDRILKPIHETYDEIDNGFEFSIKFDENTSDRISNSIFIQFVSADNRAYLIAPYHLNTLQRLSASGTRIELLQEVGNMNLEDREIEELLAELDRVLVIDQRSIWRLSNSEIELSNDIDQVVSLNYSQLDWSRIGELPQLRQYGTAGQRLLFGSSDIGLILHSLTNRMKLESHEDGKITVEAPDDDFGVSDGFGDDDSELSDEDTDVHDDFSLRQGPARRRLNTLWKNFLKRFFVGFSDPDFIELVGSTVVIPTYVLINHLCRRLRKLEMIDLDFLNEIQIKLWKFMWGSEESAGYMNSLSSAEKKIATKFLLEHDDCTVMIVSIVDIWSKKLMDDTERVNLRSAWLNILANKNWKPGKDCLINALRISVHCDRDMDQLFGKLHALASFHRSKDLMLDISKALGLPNSSVRLNSDTVMRFGVKQTCSYIELSDADLTFQMACEGMQAWKSIEVDRTYFRIQSANAVAIIDDEFYENFFFDKATGDESKLETGKRAIPEWEKRLNSLFA